MPPVTDKTNGVKEECSTSFVFLYVAACDWFLLEGARGLNTLTSRYVFRIFPPQTPLADISKRAFSWLFAEAPLSWSALTGCRLGSTHTSLHTSVRRDAVVSLISLCLNVPRKPSFGTGEGMLHIEVFATVAFGGQASWGPAIA